MKIFNKQNRKHKKLEIWQQQQKFMHSIFIIRTQNKNQKYCSSSSSCNIRWWVVESGALISCSAITYVKVDVWSRSCSSSCHWDSSRTCGKAYSRSRRRRHCRETVQQWSYYDASSVTPFSAADHSAATWIPSCSLSYHVQNCFLSLISASEYYCTILFTSQSLLSFDTHDDLGFLLLPAAGKQIKPRAS